MNTLRATVTPEPGKRLAIGLRDHILHVDQPLEDGGQDGAPTPTELLLASLASCVAHYARSYLHRHELPDEGLHVEATAELVLKPARLDNIAITLTLPDSVPAARRDALLAVASRCTVHNTLHHEPAVTIALADSPAPQEIR